MSKVFQVMGNLCHWDATNTFPNLEATKGRFAPNIVFVEAPDYVFEGWGYDDQAEGDERFVKPMAPDGWVYDDATGTFYPEGFQTEEEKLEEATKQVQELGDSTAAIEDALCEMDIAYEERLAAIEDALCELDMGGTTV